MSKSQKRRGLAKGAVVPKMVSIPEDIHLSPQTEAPRHQKGADNSGASRAALREISWADFDRLVQALSVEIRKSFRAEAVVGVAHGGVFVGGGIASALKCDFYPVRISRRSRDKLVRRTPKVFGAMPAELKGKRVLVVDDVAASGETLELAKQLAAKVGAKQVRTACLVAKLEGYQAEYVGLPTDAFCVFPWDYELVAEDGRFDVEPQ
ncbi:MAG: phosphoribosyltransferase domain-containing protein [Myxococcales bacterium]|nr:phosphoribosyltransferase domain-containing protein [Myxococcales bacterium]